MRQLYVALPDTVSQTGKIEQLKVFLKTIQKAFRKSSSLPYGLLLIHPHSLQLYIVINHKLKQLGYSNCD